MTERTPIEVTNLDRYGFSELPWSRARDRLATLPAIEDPFFLGTSGPDGRPHAAGVGALWHDGDLYFTSGAVQRTQRGATALGSLPLHLRHGLRGGHRGAVRRDSLAFLEALTPTPLPVHRERGFAVGGGLSSRQCPLCG